jgi:hypothetical protein
MEIEPKNKESMIKAAACEMTLDIFYLLSYILNTESYFTTDQVETVVACQISGFKK